MLSSATAAETQNCDRVQDFVDRLPYSAQGRRILKDFIDTPHTLDGYADDPLRYTWSITGSSYDILKLYGDPSRENWLRMNQVERKVHFETVLGGDWQSLTKKVNNPAYPDKLEVVENDRWEYPQWKIESPHRFNTLAALIEALPSSLLGGVFESEIIFRRAAEHQLSLSTLFV